MENLEKYRIFAPELRRSLHIANAQLLDFQSKSNLERVSFLNVFLISPQKPILFHHRNPSYFNTGNT